MILARYICLHSAAIIFFVGDVLHLIHSNAVDALADRYVDHSGSSSGAMPARDPATLALSALSQVVDAYRSVTTS
jgi:hypothetical protein